MGALNGIKALTEGFGPLFFGSLMALFEHFPLPGAPYLLAGIITIWALLSTYELPPEPKLAMIIMKNSAMEEGSDETTELLSRFVTDCKSESIGHDMELVGRE